MIVDLNMECIDNQEKLDEMKTRLMVPTTCYEKKLMDVPRLVCSGPICVEYPMVNGYKMAHYVRVCQDPCHANTHMNKTDFSELIQSGPQFDNNGNCSGCGHSHEMHLKTQTQLVVIEDKVEDIGIKVFSTALTKFSMRLKID